jgi:hypothetical protein
MKISSCDSMLNAFFVGQSAILGLAIFPVALKFACLVVSLLPGESALAVSLSGRVRAIVLATVLVSMYTISGALIVVEGACVCTAVTVLLGSFACALVVNPISVVRDIS